jgi:transcriptional regulator with XRE-family HTH domain
MTIDPANVDSARFVQALKKWMKAEGLRQTGAAGRLGVSQPAVSGWLAGAVPSEDNLIALLEKTGIRQEEIMRPDPTPAGRRKMEAFGARLREAADTSGWSRGDIGERAGDVGHMIGSWMQGAAVPDALQLVALARATGVSVEWLATGEGEMRPGTSPAHRPLGGGMEDIPEARRSGAALYRADRRGSVEVGQGEDPPADPPAFPFVVFDLEGEDFLELEIRAKGRSEALRFTVGVRSGEGTRAKPGPAAGNAPEDTPPASDTANEENNSKS